MLKISVVLLTVSQLVQAQQPAGFSSQIILSSTTPRGSKRKNGRSTVEGNGTFPFAEFY